MLTWRVVALLAALALFGATLPSPPAAAAPASDTDALARRVEAHHRSTRDLTARFVQTYRSGLLGREVTERGVVSLKQPGLMLWEYKDPEKKTFVADGLRYYFYVPADRQVIVRDQAGEKALPSLLLSGRGDLLGQFTVASEPSKWGMEARLHLQPRKADADIQEAWLEIDGEGRIRVVEVQDAQGNLSRFRFEDIRENLGLPDRMFRFQVPKGVEVITG